MLGPFPLPRFAPQQEYQATAITAVPFALVLGYALAVIAGLIRANRHRMRAVLRPNLGRVLGAIVLMLITPLVVVNWLPWIIGMLAPFVIGQWRLAVLLPMLLLLGVPALAWYPVSCLIVSGVKRKLWRLMLFALMFWASYSALVLVQGVQSFNL